MSWDVWMEIDTGGENPAEVSECGNMTWDVSPMYYDALEFEHGIRGLDGMDGQSALKHLNKAISKMVRNAEKYRVMNPENGLGNYDSALHFLEVIRNSCVKNPKAILRVI